MPTAAEYIRGKELLLSSKSVWISRLGGSDTNAVYEYLKFKEISQYGINNIKKYNGYFDHNNDPKLLPKFVEMYTNSIDQSDLVQLLAPEYFTMKDKTENYEFLCSILKDKEHFSYTWIEGVRLFLEHFKEFGQKKKILIISPFSESLAYQTQKDRINNILLNYTFPDCEFVFYNVPVTYNSEETDQDFLREETRGCSNFFELADKMWKEIKVLDFDIAFLSCASYSMFFGPKIKNELQKSSIYVGGLLNVLFNIHGDRYKIDYCNIMNPDYHIEPFENKRYYNENNTHFKSEGFNAYFGKIKK